VRNVLPAFALLATCAALALSPADGRAGAPEDSLSLDIASPGGAETPPSPPRRPALEPLVAGISAHPYRLEPGVRPYRNRLSVSPGYGEFGTDRLYTLRVAYNPQSWFGYEAAIGHTPGQAVHAVMHTLSAVVRRPFPGRLQPYLAGGYGMVIVFPGQSLNALPVTKNALTFGGGLEFYLRSDLALRGELRQATIFGEQRNREGLVAYQYSQGTLGLSFYRSIQP
jgi:hypothetical protein